MLSLRVMVEVDDVAEAEKELGHIVSQVKPFAAITDYRVAQYWKIPTYWEIALYLDPLDSVGAVYECLLCLAMAGWSSNGIGEDRWAVWSPTDEVEFLISRVKWAELQG